MRYYAVIDTNVLVSAILKWESVPGNIMELTMNGLIIPVLNDDIVAEYRAVLLRPKFHLTEGIVESIINGIVGRGIFVDPQKLELELPDPKDKIFYEVVMEKRKSDDAHLVTGNIKHFPAEYFIVTPRQMLDIVLNDSNRSE